MNNAVPGNLWVEDAADMTGTSVQNGSFRVQKDNDNFGTNYLQIDNITTGTVWMVAEMDGWSFSSLVGPGEFDSSQPEEIRFAFLNNDTGNSGSTITSQFEIERNAGGGVELNGQALGSGTNIAPFALNLNQTQPFTIVMELDQTANSYEIFIDDGGAGFSSIGTGAVDPSRDANSIRFVANNNFSGTGEFFDIDRFYITDTNPIMQPTDLLKLEINTVTGATRIYNDTTTEFDINAYRITSPDPNNSLNFAGWDSLSDKNPLVDPVDGPDAGTILGDGIGETWDEAGGSDNSVLAESFLLGSSVFGENREESLGLAFQPGASTDGLKFEYRSAANGAVFEGDITFTTDGPDGDFDSDGDVDVADLTRWQRGDSPNSGSAGDLADWEMSFGVGSGLSAPAAAAVPEPGGLAAALLLAVTAALRTRNRIEN